MADVDGFDDAAFAGDDLPIGGGGEGHDEVSGAIVAAVGGEVGSVQAAGHGAAVACDPVEGAHVGAPPCVHGHLLPGKGVVGPGVHHGPQRSIVVRGDPDAVVLRVPGHGLGDVPGPELGKGLPFPGVVLADVLVEDVDVARVSVEDGPQRAAGADGVELAVVTHHDDLGAGEVGGGEEAEHGGIVGHPGFIQDDHVTGSQREGVMVKSPQE